MADAAAPAASTKTNYTADVKDLKPPDWKNANIYDKPAMMRRYLPWRTSVIHLLITIDNLFDFAAKAGVSDKYDDPHKVVLKPCTQNQNPHILATLEMIWSAPEQVHKQQLRVEHTPQYWEQVIQRQLLKLSVLLEVPVQLLKISSKCHSQLTV